MKLRKPHELKPTLGKYIPKRFIFFDTETIQIEINRDTMHQYLKLGYGAFYIRNNENKLELQELIHFTKSDNFWSWVKSICFSKSTTYLIAHNLIFDLTVLNAFSKLPAAGWDLESFYSKGMVSMFRWTLGDIKLYGQDNMNLFPRALAYWGDLLNFPKLTIDFETATETELRVYCVRDVEIMVKCMETWFTFLVDNECGSFKQTIASTAFNTWRHKHLKHKVHIHSTAAALDLERRSYKGGRTECLFVGSNDQGPFYYLDVNNMYGYVLQNYEFPAGLWGVREDSNLDRLKYKMERYAVIAEVLVTVPKRIFPIKLSGHTAYPTGSFQTVLTTPELKIALQQDYIQEIYSLAWYRKEKLFKNYIQDFRELREKYHNMASFGYEEIVKLLINGLYGKFGQRKLTQEKIGSCDPNIFKREQVYNMDDHFYYDQVYLGGSIFREIHQGESFHSFPAIAAHVTAYARLYLTWFLDQIPEGHVYYMDTDSLIVDQVGYEALKYYLDDTKIGMLKMELKSDWLEIHAPKDYKMEGRTRVKGIKKDAIEISPGKWHQWQWPGLSGIISKSMDGPYEIKSVIKQRRGNIYSGIVSPSGWVQPFFLEAAPPSHPEFSDLPPELL